MNWQHNPFSSNETDSMNYCRKSTLIDQITPLNRQEKVQLPSIADRTDAKLVLNTDEDHFDNSKQTEVVSVADDSRNVSKGHYMRDWDPSLRFAQTKVINSVSKTSEMKQY